MDFNRDKPIYLQIADYLSDLIIRRELKDGDRLLSVRELGASFGVNPNTVMRTYDYLENEGVIANKRGIGFFVAPSSSESVRKTKRKEFIDNELRRVAENMCFLGVTLEEFSEIYMSAVEKSGGAVSHNRVPDNDNLKEDLK